MEFCGNVHLAQLLPALHGIHARPVVARAVQEEHRTCPAVKGKFRHEHGRIVDAPRHVGRVNAVRERIRRIDGARPLERARLAVDLVHRLVRRRLGTRREQQEQLRAELNKTRQERISAFKFWGKQKNASEGASVDEKFTEAAEKTVLPPFLQKISDRFSGLNSDFSPFSGEEYTDFNERKNVFNRLVADRKGVLIRLLIIGILGVALFVTDIAASASASANANGFFSVFGGSYIVFTTVNLVALLVCAALMAGDLKNGLFSLLKLHPKADTSLFFLMVSVLAQNICAYFTQLKLEENVHLLTPAAILLCLPYLFGKLF